LTSVLSFGLWGADITYVPTWAAFLYLAIVLHALEPGRDRLGHGTASPHRVSSIAERGFEVGVGLRAFELRIIVLHVLGRPQGSPGRECNRE
jgi:hypothetical protein